MNISPHYADDSVTLYHGDCIDVMRSLPDNSVDAVVTDPPYALNFMGKKWDDFSGVSVGACEECGDDDPADGYRLCVDCMESLDEAALKGSAMLGHQSQNWSEKATHSRGYADNNNAAFQRWCKLWATEALRVLKPGGHLLAFGGTRTWHRLAVAIEDAGFEVRDSIAWMYGSGFPKSLDVSKAIYKGEGHWRGKAGQVSSDNGAMAGPNYERTPKGDPTTPAAQQWQGWGTALKPAFEPVVVARKPLIGTVAENVLTHGTGALNVDGCRVGTTETLGRAKGGWGDSAVGASNYGNFNSIGVTVEGGRWPANVILDESQAAELDRQSGWQKDGTTHLDNRTVEYDASGYLIKDNRTGTRGYNGEGGASRFFYTAKASTDERPRVDGIAHPTVKPLDLMRYLVRLVTPPGGTVLEPFAGSGTTAEACVVEGFRCVAIEREADYLPLITARLSKPIEMTLL